jgi:glutamate synthase domain-containing protein 2
MSVVIIGGHDRMVCQYKKICKEHKCKAKVFTQMPAKLSSQIGSPDLIMRLWHHWLLLSEESA